MNEHSFDQLLDAWMDLGPTNAPDRVADAARLEVRTTRQRPAFLSRWATRRFPEMNNTMKFALAAAAVIAAVVGLAYFVTPNVGSPGPADPSLTVQPDPASTQAVLDQQEGLLAAGSYLIDNVDPMRITVAVPEGWQKNAVPAAVWTPNSEAHIGFATVDNVFADPCSSGSGLADPAVGPTVDDLVSALQGLAGIEVTAPTDVTVDGFSGKSLELTAPDDTCAESALWIIQPANEAMPLEAHAQVWILDVDGNRLVITAQDRPGAVALNVEQMHAMVDSLQIEP
jgi:hypothetical protein